MPIEYGAGESYGGILGAVLGAWHHGIILLQDNDGQHAGLGQDGVRA